MAAPIALPAAVPSMVLCCILSREEQLVKVVIIITIIRNTGNLILIEIYRFIRAIIMLI
jgi:hypothetical protein